MCWSLKENPQGREAVDFTAFWRKEVEERKRKPCSFESVMEVQQAGTQRADKKTYCEEGC